MKKIALTLSVILTLSCSHNGSEYINELRPSAVPLITIDPYLSLWSFADTLSSDDTRHWTGKVQPLQARLQVDGNVYRVMGSSPEKSLSLIPTGKSEKWDARYTRDSVPEGWYLEDFDDSSWNEGKGGFGTSGKVGIGTEWADTGDIYIRRIVTLDSISSDLILECSHDESYDLYINGNRVVSDSSYTEFYECSQLTGTNFLRPGRNLLACHCHNGYGAANIDFGILIPQKSKSELQAEQISCNVLPTRTIYNFKCGAVDLELVFTAPLLMDNLDIMSRPVNYIGYNVTSNDGEKHDVEFTVSATPAFVVDSEPEPVFASSGTKDGINYVKCGTVEQRILARKGDNVRIDWGYLYLASLDGRTSTSGIRSDDFEKDSLTLTFRKDLGSVGRKVSRNFMMVAYDDVYSVQYFWRNLRPWWNRSGQRTIMQEICDAARQYDSLSILCSKFDNELMQKAEKTGGRKYAEICAVAYRQAVAAHKLVLSPEGDTLFLSKENFSNGSIGTVDVTYPSSPLFLLYNPALARGLLSHIFYYSESGRWTKPFAAHDIGTYPVANGQTYTGDMPVEETGNMLIITDAISKAEGNAEFASRHWETLTTWAEYLAQFGLDPEEQLCTDDFAGHLAHNANLSIKAILALASYADLAAQLGKEDISEKYFSMARGMADKWKKMAFDEDHYRLTFDRPGTWSQKYNLVWDRVLGLDLFDDNIAKDEVAYYLTKQNRYGMPLDSRKEYTKIDWIVWCATMAENREDFEKLVEPLWRFQNETLDRLPMSDWIHSDRPTPVGFRARSVVGGLFMPLLKEELERKR